MFKGIFHNICFVKHYDFIMTFFCWRSSSLPIEGFSKRLFPYDFFETQQFMYLKRRVDSKTVDTIEKFQKLTVIEQKSCTFLVFFLLLSSKSLNVVRLSALLYQSNFGISHIGQQFLNLLLSRCFYQDTVIIFF